jgi:competence protein ComEC
VLHKEIPFLRIGLPLCAGIISGLYIKPDTTILVMACFIVLSGFVLSLFFNKYLVNIIFGFFLTVALFLCGLLLYTNEKKSISTLKPGKALFICTLSDYPEEKENSSRLIVKLNSKTDGRNSEALKGSLLIYNRKDSTGLTFLPGDILIIRLAPLEIVNRGNPCEFDYRFFMENLGIRYYAFTRSQDIIGHTSPAKRKLIHKALIIREKIINMYRERGITGERLALVAAITLGQKSMLDQEQKQNFIKAGVMHIMAVSGLHAIILSLFIFNLLFFMKGKFNILRIIITILLLWSFAYVTGLTPSVMRATIMFSFLQAGKLLRRPVNGINSVFASAFVLILIKPSVIFDAGFLLSYSAVIYIICFFHNFYKTVIFKRWLPDQIWQSAVVTMVAQAGTLPLTIMLFNRFPTYFILANITIVPLSNLLIITGCMVPMFFHIPIISRFLAMLLNYLTGFTEYLTSQAAALPYSTIENIGLTPAECVLLICAIFLFSMYLTDKNNFPVKYSLIFMLLYIIAGTALNIESKIKNELIIYNTPGSLNVGIKTGIILNLLSDTSLVVPEVKKHCATLGLKIKPTLIKKDLYCVEADDKRILITNVVNSRIMLKYEPDIIILTGPIPKIENHLDLNHYSCQIIFSSGVRPVFRIPEQVILPGKDSTFFIRKSGAFIKRI